MWSHRLTTDQHTQQKKLHETSERTTWSAVVPLMVKNWPAKAGDTETRVRSLGQEDPLEEGTEAHSSVPAWRISQTEEPGGLQSTGPQRVEQY